MDSYNFHFERMSNVDLQPLSLPVSRLSPAKSNSSIVEQLSHHQHGKGDSAYSSFSGGSTAPDYPSPFPEDMQSSTFCHYSDNKYVKSIYQPTQVLQSDSKTMDQLYRSVEAISQQISKQHKLNSYPSSSSSSSPRQFHSDKNLENSRGFQYNTEINSQQLQPQQQTGFINRHFESQRKRSNSVNDWLGSEPTRSTSPWNARQSFINSSIQHKGQFYFVTGVCKQPDSSMRTHSLSVCGSESCAEISTLENYTSLSLEDDLISKDQENYQPPLRLTQSSPSFNTFEESENREIGRHTANNPIFYCGPDRNSSAHTPTQMMEVTSLINNEQNNIHKKEDFTKRGKRQPLGDVACDRINKETTPLLYHLTGANRAPLKPRKEPGQENGTINDARMPPDEMKRNNRGEVACNTLDDSFKKYYKEKLKDAQSKVLRETSFKRRDLQLSWPHRVRQNPEPRYSAIHSVFSSLDSEFSIDTLIPAVTPEETESLKEDVNEYEEKTSHKMVKEMGRSANEAQPQVVRIRGRKRLTAEQKKMCYSEPEKLNQLGSGPDQLMCRSFSNGSETMLAGESEGDEQLQNEAQGLVAARRKVFETRGRTLSASNVSKTNLKHLQHKALVEYMERKTGQKVAEPQQPAPQTPLPPRQRHSLGEKPFDWGPRPLSGNMESKLIKKKLHRPHSAGRILDSSTSSMRYAQFFSALSCSGQFAGQQNQTRRRESQGPAQVKSASEPAITSVPEGQQPVRVIGLRGKSMEELGTSKVAKISALSRSSEQLDQLWRYSTEPGHTDREKKRDLFSDEVGENNPQGQTQNQTLKKSCEPEADTTAEKANLSRSTSPISSSSSRVRSQSALPESDDLKVQTYSVPELGNEQSVDEPSEDNQPPDLTNQVSLSCGITTDRSLWILPPNEELKEEVQSSPATVFFESTNSVSSNQTRENTASPRLSTSDTDISQHVGNRKLSETENEKVGETVVLEERGTPEGETDSMRTPVERPLWGELVKTIVKADQSLARVLYPLANRKTALMLMEQLLSEDTLLMEEHYKKKQEQKSMNEGSEPMPQSASDSLKSEGTDLQMSYINERLHSLEETRSALQLDMDENAARGDALVVLVRERCQPVELERYNLFIGDLDRVVSLLLCLSARLARVQNALSTVDEDTDAEEKQSLDSRHRLLCKQREDAKDLKDNLDRRENLVSTFLSRQLSAEQLQDYRRFVQTKASLLIQQKDLEEKQRLAEEQLEALSNSLKL
uniref:Protein Shroom1-like n=1 Tax=Gouania willdenowi TaxID=441366 RepID=A0A8C5H688_GOUWI